MAKKTSKSTTSKKSTKNTKSVQSKKTSQPKVKKSSAPAWRDGLYGLFAGAMTYGFASWAIDSGSLWHYLFSFISFYYATYFIKQFIKKTVQLHRGNK